MTMRHVLFIAATSVSMAMAGSPAQAQPLDGEDSSDFADDTGTDDTATDDTATDTTATDTTATDPAPEAASGGDSALAGYKKGFFIKQADGPFSLHTKLRVQGRYTYEAKTDDRTDESAFSIARARLTMSGKAFSEDVSYKFQADMGKGNVVLKDFFVDYRIGGGEMRVRAGQWKRPFSRQQINSSSKLELVDRAITDKTFGAGRDIGVAIHNNYEKSPELEWAVGVFNGTGDKPRFSGDADPMTGEVSGGFSNVPDMFGPAIVARAGWNSPDLKGYSEADLEGGPFRFGVGASVLVELDSDNDDSSAIKGEVDYIGKVNGLSTSAGVYVSSGQDGMGFADQAYTAFGAHLQAGYMLDKKLQPAVRFAIVANDDEAAGTVIEGSGGVSYYMYKHGLKWQTDIALLRASATVAGADVTTNDIVARSQLQLSF